MCCGWKKKRRKRKKKKISSFSLFLTFLIHCCVQVCYSELLTFSTRTEKAQTFPLSLVMILESANVHLRLLSFSAQEAFSHTVSVCPFASRGTAKAGMGCIPESCLMLLLNRARKMGAMQLTLFLFVFFRKCKKIKIKKVQVFLFICQKHLCLCCLSSTVA